MTIMYYSFLKIIPQNDFRRKKFNKHLFCTAPSPKKDKARKGVDRKALRRKAPKKMQRARPKSTKMKNTPAERQARFPNKFFISPTDVGRYRQIKFNRVFGRPLQLPCRRPRYTLSRSSVVLRPL